MDQNGPLRAKMDHSFGPFWAILVQYTFRQYRGHSLFKILLTLLFLPGSDPFCLTSLLIPERQSRFSHAVQSAKSLEAIALKVWAAWRLHSLRAQILKKFNLAWNFQSRLKISRSIEFSILTSRIPHKKIGVWWVARLKISISLENFKILIFFKIWALRVKHLVFRGGNEKGQIQKVSPERCRFRCFPFSFPFFYSFRFFAFFVRVPIFSFFPLFSFFSRNLPFRCKKKTGRHPFARSLLRNPELKGTNGATFAVFLADFCWFPLIFVVIYSIWQVQIFSQETADFRRKPQETAEFRRNPFVPFSLSLLVLSNCKAIFRTVSNATFAIRHRCVAMNRQMVL